MENMIAKVTQVVNCEIFNKKKFLTDSGLPDGSQNTLDMNYMKPLKVFLEKVSSCCISDKNKVIIVAPSKYVAYQAALLIKKRMWQDELPDDGGAGYYEDEEAEGVDTDYTEMRCRQEGILLCHVKSGNDDQDGMAEMLMNIPVNACKGKEVDYSEKCEYAMIELPPDIDADEALKQLDEVQSKHVIVFVASGADAQEIIKNMVFEEMYRVVRLEQPTFEEYVMYGNAFMEKMCFALADDITMQQVISDVMAFRGSRFTEGDIYIYILRAISYAMSQKRPESTLCGNDFFIDTGVKEIPAEEQLNALIGLDAVKSELHRKICVKALNVKRNENVCGNLIFAGNPGTGKSESARLYALILGEKNITRGVFITAARSDIIGRYVGHTAPRIRSLFERARGGVIFVDEASFLIPEDTRDPFVNEAVTEFVRFMEMYRDVNVIFATYPDEAEKLLHIDPGFESRITGIVKFPDYSDDELMKICRKMAADKHFSLEKPAEKLVRSYINDIRGRDNFGNARDIRKLLETAEEEYAVDCTDGKCADDDVIKASHIKRAAALLMRGAKDVPAKISMGF